MRLLICIVLPCVIGLAGAEPTVSADDLPRLPAPSLAESQAALHVRPGLRVELAASEPNVVDPVAMAFDEFGALYVVEMRDYPLPERRDQKMGTVRKLVDADGDGVFEKSTVFLKDLSWPTGIACARGGVYVLASPELIFAFDTNNDGVADERQIIATGFASGKAKPNVQALPNSLTWGPDGRLWGSTAGNGGLISGQSLNGQDFSLDPATNKIQREVGTAQFGLTFDERGRRFVCSNSHHLQWVPWERRHGANTATLLDIPVDGPAAEVFRTSPEEAWRVVRTRWRATGQVAGLVEGGGRSSGYFTSACGLHVYRGDALGVEFLGNVFICDVGSNLVHRKIIRQQGDTLIAERAADEVKSEFLTSDSNWFRPVACTTGPDGALYIADMAREIIEHPDSLPDNIKSHLDLASGENLGRIWRVVPTDWKRPQRPLPPLNEPAQLVRMLEHPNAWHRETAQRLLSRIDTVEGEVTRPAPGQAEPALRDAGLLTSPATDDPKFWQMSQPLLHQSASPLVLAILANARDLRVADVKRVWKKIPAPGQFSIVRWLAECEDVKGKQNLTQEPHLGLAEAQQLALAMAQSSDPFVLAELPAILRPIWGAETGAQLLRLYRKDSARVKQAVRLAAKSSEILTMAQETHDPELWGMLGKSADNEFRTAARNFLESSEPISLAELAALGVSPSTKVLAAIKAEFAKGNFTQSAVALLIKANPPEVEILKQSVMNAQIPQALRAQLVPALEASAVEQLLSAWATQPILIRQEVLDWYLKSSARAKALLEHIAAGRPAKEELSASQINQARRWLPEPTNAIFGTPVDRQKVINDHLGALTLSGNATKGETTFRQRCLVCHRHGNEGNAVGPERKTFRNLGKPSLLVNLLDPNREVAGAYQLITLKTKSGETHAGLLMSEDAHEIHFRSAQGQEMALLREQVEKLELSNRSLMPEGLEQGLSDQDLADLLALLVQP